MSDRSALEYDVRLKANRRVWRLHDARRAALCERLDRATSGTEVDRVTAELEAVRRNALDCSRAVQLQTGRDSVVADIKRVRAEARAKRQHSVQLTAHIAQLAADLDTLRRRERDLVDALIRCPFPEP